ncbi:hypothetical protein DUZ99_16175, partial [Xylanibacillus composti]|nr:hypothetical protein [Xylanibacillus composti]
MQKMILLLLIVSLTIAFPPIESQAVTLGTADGTYDFGSLSPTNDDSGVPGFKKQGDKFHISNNMGQDGTMIYSADNTGYFELRAEGGSVVRHFTLDDLHIVPYNYANHVLRKINIVVTYVDGTTATLVDYNGSLEFQSGYDLSNSFLPGISRNYISKLVITWDMAVHAADLNFHSISISNVDTRGINANLSNLALSAGSLTPAFDSDTTTYSADAGSASSITVTPTLADSSASVTVNGTAVTSGTPSVPIPLDAETDTPITIEVTAENGIIKKNYIVSVSRTVSNNADLSNLALSAGSLSPVFASSTITYTSSVGNEVNSLTVTPTVADSTATVTVNGTA